MSQEEVRIDYVPIDQVRKWPRNPKDHDVPGIERSIKQFGFVNPLLKDEKTGRLVAGHGRLETVFRMFEKGLQPPARVRVLGDGTWAVPVVRGVSFRDEKQAEAYVVADNRLTELGGWETDKLLDILRDVDTNPDVDLLDIGFNEYEVDALEKALEKTEAKEAARIENEQAMLGVGASFNGVTTLTPDVVFPSQNAYGIPDLLEDQLSHAIPTDVWTGDAVRDFEWPDKLVMWGSNKFPENMKGAVLGFYVDDKRFEGLWTDPIGSLYKMAANEWAGIIVPDFSLFSDMPYAVCMWNVYRARWLARYWQEVGLNIIPSLTWGAAETMKFSIETLPKRAPVIAFQVRTLSQASNKYRMDFIRELNEALTFLEPDNVLVYGGTQHRAWLEKHLVLGPQYHMIEAWTKARWRGIEKAKRTSKPKPSAGRAR